MATLQQRLTAGDTLIIDGGTGTELEKRGAVMDGEAWVGATMQTAPDMIRKIHRDFIEAGADIIIANTYAAAPHVLKYAGFSLEEALELNRLACRLAHEAVVEAAVDRNVYVAGSLSSFRAGLDLDKLPDEAEAQASYTAQVDALVGEGCDLLIAEMLLDNEVSPICARATVTSGLPAWLGLSARLGDDGTVMGFSRRQVLPFEDVMEVCLLDDAQAAGIMHSDVEATRPALEALKARWSGPLFAYAHSGDFIMPHWQFETVISPSDYADEARTYTAMGVSAVGGCCGLGPEHIASVGKVLS
ncbi:MAG: hypothetical protein CMM46_16535 [Rhodospirillaceae bacterium]|nr:hypothetical protein [Rhodospirillaceae bacterium]|tara:strand:+ start:3001 stop:3906 length:906 start_codon:yes stop_codon:yes gene_type:complete